MAKSVKKSALSSKIGQALKAHAKDETDFGMDFTSLPPGIVGGVAQLTGAAVGVYKKGPNEGEKFLRLAGTVVEPDEVNVIRKTWQDGKVVNLPLEVVKVKGLQTSRMVPLCETKNARGEVTDADENIATALNELRMLGGEEFTEGLAGVEDPEAELDSLLESLVEAAPHFKFSTSTGTPTAQYPDARTWENWRGAIADYVGEEGGGVDDRSSNKGKDEPEESSDEPPDDPKVLTSASDAEDLDALAEMADHNDAEDQECVDAQNRLQELAEAAGVDPDAKDKKGKPLYPTWASMVDVLKPDEEEPDGPPVQEEEDWKPAKEEVYNCKLPGTRKAMEVEVVLVDEKKKTINVKRLDTGNTVKNVSWDLLEQ